MKFLKIMRPALAVIASAILTAASTWALTLNDLPTRRVNGRIVYYYDVQPGDSLYGIAEKLGVSVNDIKRNNPSVADGVKPKMRLFFPTELQSSKSGDSAGPLSHVVKKGESVYGIARQYGLTMEELMALNPQAADGIKPGERLNLPGSLPAGSAAEATASAAGGSAAQTAAQALPDAAADMAQAAPQEKPKKTKKDKKHKDAPSESELRIARADSIAAAAEAGLPDLDGPVEADGETAGALTADSVAPAEEPVQVAVILPFLLQEETMGRQTQLFTEFYKGFLLAADTLNRAGRQPVNIRVYDSSANNDSVRSILKRPEMGDVDLIIAPDNLVQLRSIATIAPDDALILNVFAVRDTTYMTRPGMIQTNIPHDEMYRRAIDGFCDSYAGFTPVFLARKGGRRDKEEFTDELRKRLDSDGVAYRTVEFDGYMPDADLEDFDPNVTPLVFIPESGNRDEFQRVIHALRNVKGRADVGSNVQLFGYPEWATFRGEQFDQICDMQTTIYSRYFPTERDSDARSLHHAFREAFGEDILDKQMPVLGILGYDTGMMVIEGLRSRQAEGGFPTEFSGIQSGIRLSEVPGGGMYNDALFLIRYMPGGSIEKSLK